MGQHNWDKEKYSVKNDVLDEQHQFLFDIINELDNVIQKKSSGNKVQELLEKLHEYTVFHFKTEEEILSKTDYPELKKHAEEHTSFVEKIKRFTEDYKSNMEEVTQQLGDYLFYWLFFHIQCDDQDYSKYLTNREGK